MDPITVYYSPVFYGDKDWTLLFPKPKTLFNTLRQDKADSGNNTVLSCPAFSNKTKRILVFRSPMSFELEYKWTSQEDNYINGLSKSHIAAVYERLPSFNFGPSIEFSFRHIFFAEQSLNAYFTPPMFQEPKYTKYGAVTPGEFDIGRWFRAFNFEVQMWSNSGILKIEKDEPLFYVEFRTDRPIILKRFNITENTHKYMLASKASGEAFGRGVSLDERYERFDDVGFGQKILTDIKQNLIDEEPLKF